VWGGGEPIGNSIANAVNRSQVGLPDALQDAGAVKKPEVE